MFYPGHEILGHEGFIAEISVVWIIRIPGIKRECRLDYRKVVSVLSIERSHGLEAIPVSATLPWVNPQHDKEIVSYPRGRVRRRQYSQYLRTVAVTVGNYVI